MNQDNQILSVPLRLWWQSTGPRTTVFMKPASEHTLTVRRSSGRFVNICLYSRTHVSPRPVTGQKWVCRGWQVCWWNHCLWFILCNKFPRAYKMVRNPRNQVFTHARYCPVNTELIDGHNSAKKQLCSVWVTTEVYRQFPTSFASWSSSFQSTCSAKYGMSAFTEVEQHVFSNIILFSILLVCFTRTISFLIQVREMTNVRAGIFVRTLPQSKNSQYIFLFSLLNHTMSLYIDMKKIRAVNCSSSNCILSIIF